jgi:hypothetical protein
MTDGFWLLRAVLVLFLWISAWNLIDQTVLKFVKRYTHRMLVYGIMFTITLIALIVIVLFAPVS